MESRVESKSSIVFDSPEEKKLYDTIVSTIAKDRHIPKTTVVMELIKDYYLPKDANAAILCKRLYAIDDKTNSLELFNVLADLFSFLSTKAGIPVYSKYSIILQYCYERPEYFDPEEEFKDYKDYDRFLGNFEKVYDILKANLTGSSLDYVERIMKWAKHEHNKITFYSVLQIFKDNFNLLFDKDCALLMMCDACKMLKQNFRGTISAYDRVSLIYIIKKMTANWVSFSTEITS